MIYINTFENFDKVNEEVSGQFLYHYTTLSNLYLILKSNKMIARSVGDSSRGDWRKISNKSLSFTRNHLSLSQLCGMQDGLEEPIRIVIQLDADKLKERYKIVPWSDSRSKSNEVNNSQFEERVTSDIVDIRKYITRIEIIYNQIISGVSFNDNKLKNDNIRLGSGKDDSQASLPFDEFIKSEFFKKSLYTILSLDKNLKRKFRQIFNSIIKNTGRNMIGNVILDSNLLICLWNWWLFNKTKSMSVGITFDYKNQGLKQQYVIGSIKLNSSEKDLIKSLTDIKDSILSDFNEKYEEQISQISRTKEYREKEEKNIEKQEKEKEEKYNQEIKSKENLKKWKEEEEVRKKKKFDSEIQKEKEIRRKINSKLNSELVKDESYLSIVKWANNSKFNLLTDKSDVEQFLTELNFSLYKIKDENLKLSISENIEQINKLLRNCTKFDKINETIVKCKELMSETNQLLSKVKNSTFSKIKKFLNI